MTCNRLSVSGAQSHFSLFFLLSIWSSLVTTVNCYVSPVLVANDDTPQEPPVIVPMSDNSSLPDDFQPHNPENPFVTRVRIHVTPLDGATYLWLLFPPFVTPIGSLLGHPHVVISDEGYPGNMAPRYRVVEYHPHSPPIISMFHGTGRIDTREFAGWIPGHRRGGRHYIYAEERAIEGRRFADIERFNKAWGNVYDMSTHNCQRFAVEMMVFMTGVSYRDHFWIDSVPTLVVILLFLGIGSTIITTCLLRCIFGAHNRVLKAQIKRAASWQNWQVMAGPRGRALRQRIPFYHSDYAPETLGHDECVSHAKYL
eukprot:TRINITY_DN34631_c0_g1_i1.p1 TRINITY_DN34631_c0_g1~~TRINITY_DN34631_c0_g1_i1.p1  ORF type:complete len:312 (+),score=32.31 TRINITY_DN34631_c0_g1_i1:159-1094(+)